MLDFLKKKTEINTTQIVDEIEAAVYEHIKPYGFKKHGRTLHRFVSEDISQVIHFQCGMPSHGMSGLLCVNLGIRIPECSERTFQPKTEKKKYYPELSAKISFPKMEEEILKFWEEDNTFEKSVKNRDKAEEFVFYDGPPFANGTPHYGHIMVSYVKDTVQDVNKLKNLALKNLMISAELMF